jgi:hypothetical protein
MATGITLADLLTDSARRKLAGERSYARGIGYFRCEAVSRELSREQFQELLR